MKKIKYYTLVLAIFILVGVLFLVSCNKSVDGNVSDPSKSRSFTPTALSIKTSKDSALFTWTSPLFSINNMTYKVDIATDTLFSNIVLSVVADTTNAYATDSFLLLNTPYYARVSVNQYLTLAGSNYCVSTHSFKLLGFQYLKVIRDFDITTNSVLLNWYLNSNTSGVTNVVLTQSGGSPISIPVSSTEATAGSKNITGLIPGKKYALQLFAGNKSMGTTTFTTPPTVNFTKILTAGVDDLAAAITAAVDGDVIGLNSGTYNLTSSTSIIQKSISIRSVSNNPADTKVFAKELDIVGTGAGVTLAGIDFSGNYTGTSYGAYFMQLYGSVALSSAPATFTNIKIDNCLIHDYTRCIVRGNAGTNSNDFKIGTISVNNTQMSYIDSGNTGGYYNFSLERLQFNNISFTKSTFYGLGQGMFNISATLTAYGITPTINIEYCTMNDYGGNGKYPLFDANANAINYTMSNSILANTPINGTLKTAAFRASASSNLSFSNNDYFRFASSVGGLDLVLTGLIQANDITTDLGWQPSTTSFSLASLPSSNPIFTASSNLGTVGDPRWAY